MESLNSETLQNVLSQEDQFLSLSRHTDELSDHSSSSGRSVRSNYLITKLTMLKLDKQIKISESDVSSHVHQVTNTLKEKLKPGGVDVYDPQQILDTVEEARANMQRAQTKKSLALSELMLRTKSETNKLQTALVPISEQLQSSSLARKKRGSNLAAAIGLQSLKKFVMKERVQTRIEKRLIDEIRAQCSFCLASDRFEEAEICFGLRPKSQCSYRPIRGSNESRLSKGKVRQKSSEMSQRRLLDAAKVITDPSEVRNHEQCVLKNKNELEQAKQKTNELIREFFERNCVSTKANNQKNTLVPHSHAQMHETLYTPFGNVVVAPQSRVMKRFTLSSNKQESLKWQKAHKHRDQGANIAPCEGFSQLGPRQIIGKSSQFLTLSLKANENLTVRASDRTDQQREVPFNKSHLFAMMQKEVSQRTESDLRELKQIIMEIDFIKNNQLNFQASDLSEMIKTATLKELKPLSKLCSQGEDADYLYFVVQGCLLATYTLSAQDKKVIIDEDLRKVKPEHTPDDLVKALSTLRAVKDAGQAAKAEDELESSNSSSRLSRKSGRSRSSKMQLRQSSAQKFKTFLTQLDADWSADQLQSIVSATHPDLVDIINNYRYLNVMLDKRGECERQKSFERQPLNAIKNERSKAIEEVISNYIREVTDRDHYVMQPVREQERLNSEAERQALEEQNLIDFQIRPSSRRFAYTQIPKPVLKGQNSLGTGRKSRGMAENREQVALRKHTDLSQVSDSSESVSLTSSGQASLQRPKPNILLGNLDISLHSSQAGELPAVEEFDLPNHFEEPSFGSLHANDAKVPQFMKKNKSQVSVSVGRLRSSEGSKSQKAESQPRTSSFADQSIARSELRATKSRSGSALGGLKQRNSRTFRPSSSSLNSALGPNRQSRNHSKLSQKSRLGGLKSKSTQQLGLLQRSSVNSSIQSRSLTDEEMDMESNVEDNLSLQGIVDEIDCIKKDKSGGCSEVALFNIPKGRYFGAKTMQVAEHDLKRHLASTVSLYSRRNHCYVIAIHREKYRRACDNAKNRLKTEKIDFLRSVELFSQFSRNLIKNLVRSLKKETLNRGQYLFEEGKAVEKVYFIISGEFRVSKQVVVYHTDGDEKPQIEEGEKASENNPSIPQSEKQEAVGGKQKTQKKSIKTLEVVIVSSRSVVGDDDAIIEGKDNLHQTSCRCISLTGQVYELRQEDFLKEFKKVPFWQEIAIQILTKRERLLERVNKKIEVAKLIEHSMKRKVKKPAKVIQEQVEAWTNLNGVENVMVEQQLFRDRLRLALQHKVKPRSRRSPRNKLPQTAGARADDKVESVGSDEPLATRNKISFEQRPGMMHRTSTIEIAASQNKAAVKPSCCSNSVLSRTICKRCVTLVSPSTQTEETAPTCVLTKSQSSHSLQGRPQTHSQTIRIGVKRRQGERVSQSTKNIVERSEGPAESTAKPKFGAAPQQQHYTFGLTGLRECFSMQESRSQTQRYPPCSLLPISQKNTARSSMTNSVSARTIIDQRALPRQTQSERERTTSAEINLKSLVRFLPADLKAKTGFRLKSKQMTSVNIDHAKQKLWSSSQVAAQEAKRDEIKGVLRDQEMVLKQAFALKKQAKMLKLNSKFKACDQGRRVYLTQQQQPQSGQPAETSRANFLLRQAERTRLGNNDQRGTYGYMIRKKDERVHGISALAKNLDKERDDMKKNQQGFTFSKQGTTVKGLLLAHMPQMQLHKVKQCLTGRVESSATPIMNFTKPLSSGGDEYKLSYAYFSMR